ncbi:MAG: hypothetical protein HUU32_08570 [Calditrichaceae bacterium]|nr:hypothetical protein [Calditrichia bacterium]NUQ41431.1 hypothetical protein [Calditrichaceae bacterium]
MSSVKKTLLILTTVGALAAVGVVGTFTAFVKLAETEFIPGREVYLRDVYLVIDQTLSMERGQRKEAKDVLRDEIIRSLGLGDRAFCYRISADFTETGDRVFASNRRLPKVPENVPSAPLEKLPPGLKGELLERWNAFSAERDAWLERVEAVQAPGGKYSDYLGTLEAIGRRINDPGDPHLAGEKWLIVIGDLKHEPAPAVSPPPAQHEKRAFAGVNIYLVEPGGIYAREDQQAIEAFWKKYFAARGGNAVAFVSFDGFSGRFPGNSAPDPSRLGRAAGN